MRHISPVLTLALLVSILRVASSDDDFRKKIKDLRQEKIVKLREYLNLVEDAFKSGRATHGDVLQANMDYLQGGLELAETHEQKLATHQEMVKVAEQMVETAKKLYEVNQGRIMDVKKVEIILLERKIALEKERASLD